MERSTEPSKYKLRYDSDPEFRERIKARSRKRMARLRSTEEFRELERERMRRKQRVRRATKHPGWLKQHADSVARRRAAKLGVALGRVNRLAIYDRENGRCHICGRKVSKSKFTIDHLVPIAWGGPHTSDNVRIAHGKCNSRMGAGRLPAQLILEVNT